MTVFLMVSLISLLAFGQSERFPTNKQRLDSFVSKLRNPSLIKLSFDGGFDSDYIQVFDKDGRVLLDVTLTTNNKLGLAKSLFIEKERLPLKIIADKEVYPISSYTKKFIFINNVEKKLVFSYSDSVRLYG